MASLPKKKFFVKSDGGETLEFECPVSVSKDGVFSIRLPNDIDDFIDVVKD